MAKLGGVDTSQTYLLFPKLLLLFWLHPCIIWTKLTRTDVVFSRATSVVFFCAGFWIFKYAGKIPKNYIKNQRSGSFREAKGGPQGSQGAARRVPGATQPLAAPPALLGGSHTLLWPQFILPSRKLRNRSHFFDLRRGAATTLCSSSES